LLIAGKISRRILMDNWNFLRYLKLLLVNSTFSSGTPEEVQRKRGWEALF
jgi:hypothetical protein